MRAATLLQAASVAVLAIGSMGATAARSGPAAQFGPAVCCTRDQPICCTSGCHSIAEAFAADCPVGADCCSPATPDPEPLPIAAPLDKGTEAPCCPADKPVCCGELCISLDDAAAASCPADGGTCCGVPQPPDDCCPLGQFCCGNECLADLLKPDTVCIALVGGCCAAKDPPPPPAAPEECCTADAPVCCSGSCITLEASVAASCLAGASCCEPPPPAPPATCCGEAEFCCDGTCMPQAELGAATCDSSAFSEHSTGSELHGTQLTTTLHSASKMAKDLAGVNMTAMTCCAPAEPAEVEADDCCAAGDFCCDGACLMIGTPTLVACGDATCCAKPPPAAVPMPPPPPPPPAPPSECCTEEYPVCCSGSCITVEASASASCLAGASCCEPPPPPPTPPPAPPPASPLLVFDDEQCCGELECCKGTTCCDGECVKNLPEDAVCTTAPCCEPERPPPPPPPGCCGIGCCDGYTCCGGDCLPEHEVGPHTECPAIACCFVPELTF